MTSSLFWLTDAQMARLEPFFPKSHGKPLVNDRRVLIGIIFINRNGQRWRDAPRELGPAKTLYNRWKRWSDNGLFARILTGLAAEGTEHKTIMIDATYPRHLAADGGKRNGYRAVARSLPAVQGVAGEAGRGTAAFARCSGPSPDLAMSF